MGCVGELCLYTSPRVPRREGRLILRESLWEESPCKKGLSLRWLVRGYFLVLNDSNNALVILSRGLIMPLLYTFAVEPRLTGAEWQHSRRYDSSSSGLAQVTFCHLHCQKTGIRGCSLCFALYFSMLMPLMNLPEALPTLPQSISRPYGLRSTLHTRSSHHLSIQVHGTPRT